MQPVSHLLLFPCLLLFSLSFSSANELLSCVEVNCPIAEGSAITDCRVVNQTLGDVGLASIPVPSEIFGNQDGDVNLTWTVGIDHYNGIDPDDRNQRYIERLYYLGTPPSVNLTADDLGMTLEDNNNIFYDFSLPADSSTSYCGNYLDDTCMSALNSKFSELAGEHHPGGPETDICSSIASDLQANLPSSCPGLTSARSTIVRGVSLTGSHAPSPPTEAQNSTSNCHPTLPKSNDLTRVFAYNISASAYVNETGPAVLGETPVWSVFWSKGQSEGNDDARIENPSVRMVCLRPLEKNVATEMNKVENAASTLVLSSVWGVVISVSMMMFLFEMF
ncbi:hypothetical protein EMCG_05045 [[Emmonsia] crescens]|uniref:Uncharacterized protein n=1 Tax=[Emmonsia] crescens TaxID=73230 RepID=A0A0G2HRB4_9EURO|nr:hypothetical protein EMCG_05045 [Emmonsia crescens UAMH 3008]